jgi:hypothetical protein
VVSTGRQVNYEVQPQRSRGKEGAVGFKTVVMCRSTQKCTAPWNVILLIFIFKERARRKQNLMRNKCY